MSGGGDTKHGDADVERSLCALMLAEATERASAGSEPPMQADNRHRSRRAVVELITTPKTLSKQTRAA